MSRSGRLGTILVRACLVAGSLAASGSAGSGQSATPPAPAERFEEAERAYRQGEFAAAEAAYRALLGEGIRGAEVYYNLGNTLFRQGRLGPAILNYERALRLDPSDSDVRHNLDYCRQRAADRYEAGGHWLEAAYGAWTRALSADGEGWLLLALYLPGMAALGLWIVARNPLVHRVARFAAVGLLALALPLAALVVVRARGEDSNPQAIILAERVEGRSGPGDDNAALFTVHEGLKVRIRNHSGDWVQVLLPNGLNGWVPAAAVEKV